MGYMWYMLLEFIAVILVLAFIGWVIWRLAKKKPIKAHMVMYGLCWCAGIFTIVFFMSMDIPKMAKIVTCIAVGAILIFIAAWRQQRAKSG
jgi:F0F1-type ATP synthase assembly protein I